MTTLTPSMPLTQRFKAGSKELHTLSDAMVNARLVALFADRRLYGKALGTFYLVHKQLDTCLEQSLSDPCLRELEPAMAPLYRTEAMEADLEFYLGPSWRETVARGHGPEVQAYTDHLAHLAKSNPQLLLAHSYTQHLALLAGGQIIRGLARKGMALPADRGTAAYEYQGKVGSLRSRYLDAVDRLGEKMDEGTLNKLVEEHRQAFRFNNAIIRSFRMGYLAPLKAALQLTPPTVWAALLAVALGALLTLRLLFF